MSSAQEILAGYGGVQAAQEAFYKDLHQHPELSHQEQRTAQRVAGQLQQYGCTVQAGIGGTGVVGMLSNGGGPTVLLRADMDALPVEEDTGADYASTATAQDADGSEVPVAHACGHDIHVSCLLGMTKLMADHPGQWNGTLLALFQPAEETGDGAQGMVDDGLLTRIPAPDVALAQHVLRGVAGTAGTCSGPFLSAADSIKITVYGRGGHGSMPQNTVDPGLTRNASRSSRCGYGPAAAGHDVRNDDPVSSRVLRLARTAGHPSEMAGSTALSGAKPPWVTVSLTTPWPASSISKATLERASARQAAAVASSMPTAAAHPGVIVCQV